MPYIILLLVQVFAVGGDDLFIPVEAILAVALHFSGLCLFVILVPVYIHETVTLDLPIVGECGRMENCIAALDTKRRGKDFLSMPICFEAHDPDRKGETELDCKTLLSKASRVVDSVLA